MQFLESIRKNQLMFNPNFYFNFVDVRDVAKANELNYKLPLALPKWLLYFLAGCLEFAATVTGKPAEMIRSQVTLLYGVRQEYDINPLMDFLIKGLRVSS